jgi:hypothetical protein
VAILKDHHVVTKKKHSQKSVLMNGSSVIRRLSMDLHRFLL